MICLEATGAWRTRSISWAMVAASLKQGITTDSSGLGDWLVMGAKLWAQSYGRKCRAAAAAGSGNTHCRCSR